MSGRPKPLVTHTQTMLGDVLLDPDRCGRCLEKRELPYLVSGWREAPFACCLRCAQDLESVFAMLRSEEGLALSREGGAD